MTDQGNHHVIIYYCWKALRACPKRGPESERDFDIETERREGWAYGTEI